MHLFPHMKPLKLPSFWLSLLKKRFIILRNKRYKPSHCSRYFCSLVYFLAASDLPETVRSHHCCVKEFSQRHNYQSGNLLVINGMYVITHCPEFPSAQINRLQNKHGFPVSSSLLYFVDQDIHASLRPVQNGAAFKADSPRWGLRLDYCWEIIQNCSQVFTQKSFVILLAPYLG